MRIAVRLFLLIGAGDLIRRRVILKQYLICTYFLQLPKIFINKQKNYDYISFKSNFMYYVIISHAHSVYRAWALAHTVCVAL